MTGRIVEISYSKCYLNIERGFLLVHVNQKEVGRIDLDSILAIIISGQGHSLSVHCIAICGMRLIPILCCSSNYQELSVCLPSRWNMHQMQRQLAQARASEQVKGVIWQQIIEQKIDNQAAVLNRIQSPVAKQLARLAKRVSYFDRDLLEAQAAARYWKATMGPKFKRRRNQDGINALLNYGYAVIRCAMLKAVLVAGLNQSFSIKHHNQRNPSCLVDDLMEPYRPILDYLVLSLLAQDETGLNTQTKQALASIVVADVVMDHETSPIFQQMYQTCYSLWLVLNGKRTYLKLPNLPDEKEYQSMLKKAGFL